MDHLATFFRLKWGSRDLHTRSLLSDILHASAGAVLMLDVGEVAHGIWKIRNRLRRDWQDITVKAFELLFAAQLEAFTSWLADTMSSSLAFQSCKPLAYAFGKETSRTEMSSVWVLVPQTALLQIMDAVLELKLEAFLSEKFVPHRAIWEGGRPKTQLMDIVSGLSLFVEKTLDLHSRGAIAQEDVQQHYDTMSCIRIYRWLLRNGCAVALAAACVRHQLLPSLTLNLRGATALISDRCRGGLTGSRVAGQLGRIPVQVTIRAIPPELSKKAWSYEDVTLAVASYVDNVWFLAETAYRATEMGDLFAAPLMQ